MLSSSDLAHKILVIYTGGTFGMVKSDQGLVPSANLSQLLIDSMGTATLSHLPSFDVIELSPLIDSAELRPAMWQHIAAPIIEGYDDYQGYVVIHGTDTMAYTASALSFMLQGLDKTVVITGSQIPITLPSNDAINNFSNALNVANDGVIKEVVLLFGNRVLRGNRATKVAATALQAFDSPNYPPLAAININIDYTKQLPAKPIKNFCSPNFSPHAVAVVTITPGLSSKQIALLADDTSIKVVIVQSYGVGNMPQDVITALGELIAHGKYVVNISRCLQAAVIQGHYAGSQALSELGIIAGSDMTLEAAFAKAHFCLSKTNTAELLRESLVGEMAPY